MHNKKNLSELQYTKDNMLRVLDEGYKGNQTLWNDEQVAQWCFLYFTNFKPNQDQPNDSKLQDLAFEISTQYEADLCNTNPGERVFEPWQYKGWIEVIKKAC